MCSKVFSFLKAILARLTFWFDQSLCGTCYNKFAAMCYRAYCGSFVSRLFRAPKNHNAFQHSFFGKLINLPKTFLLYLQKKFSDKITHLLSNSTICASFNQWADVSIRFYGIVLCAFSLPLLFTGKFLGISYLVAFLLLVVGALMILINRSLAQIFGGSWLATSIMGLFTETDTEKRACLPCGRNLCIIGATIGVLLFVICMAIGIKPFVLLTGGICATAFFVRYLRLGVFLTVAFSPMLPTMALVGLSFLCGAVFCLHVVADKEFTFVKSPVNTFVLFFVLALIWGCINSFSVMSSVSQVAVHISFILFYFIVLNTIRTKEQWNALLKLFLLSAFLVAAYGVVQNFTGVSSTQSWVDEEMFQDIKVRVYSFFNNPNVLGEFLVMTIPLTIAILWGRSKENHKLLYSFILLSMIACMIFTWSRGAWLGVFFACALLLVIMDKRWVFLGVLALLILPLLLVVSGNTAILERLLSVGNTQDTSTAYRVSIWQASIHMIRDFWVSGIGIGSESFKTVYPVYALAGADFALHSHNLYLQIWVEMGIIGILTLFSMFFMFFRSVFSETVIKMRKTSNTAKAVIALGTGVLGFLLQGLTDYVWYNYKILMIFWIVIALGSCGSNFLLQTSDEEGGSRT